MGKRHWTKTHWLVIGLLMLVLSGCGRAFGSFEPVETPVDAPVVAGTIRFMEGLEPGPAYNFSVTVPETWVGNFEVKNNGNTLAFVSGQSQVFTVDALSRRQYWEQVGGYPGQHTDIVFTGDTYFIYTLPIDAFWSGLPEDQYKALAGEVATAMRSFDIQPIN